MKLSGWTIERNGKSWLARLDEDKDVTCKLSDDGRTLLVRDDCQYYPSGGYDIPLSVIEALQSRRAP